MQAAYLQLHLLAQLPIQCTQWLVHEQDVGLNHHGARQCHALLLAARKLADRAVAESVEPDHAQHLVHAPGDLVPREPANGQTVGDVFRDGHVRKQRIILEHHSHVAAPRWQRGDVAAADPQAAGGRLEIAGTDVEQRRLARSGRAEQREELAWRNVEIDRAQRVELPERLADPDKFNIAHVVTSG